MKRQRITTGTSTAVVRMRCTRRARSKSRTRRRRPRMAGAAAQPCGDACDAMQPAQHQRPPTSAFELGCYVAPLRRSNMCGTKREASAQALFVACCACSTQLGCSTPLAQVAGSSQLESQFQSTLVVRGRRHLQECAGIIPAARVTELNNLVANNAVVAFGVPNTNCLIQGTQALQQQSACYVNEPLNTAEWNYFKCLQPNEAVNGNQMHSYFYIGQQYQGNGFRVAGLEWSDTGGFLTATQLSSALTAASAGTCSVNGPPASHPSLGSCQSLLSGSMMSLSQITQKITDNDVMLLGWSQCPCTGIASARFEGEGVCFAKDTWDSPSEPLMAFLNCLYGAQHHSFIFIGQTFIDNGFAFANSAMSAAALNNLLVPANAATNCGPSGTPFFADFSTLIPSAINPPKRNYGVAVTDINKDGKYDAIVAGYGSANIALSWSSTAGQFVDLASGNSVLQDSSRQAIGVAACDIDGDGYEELYVLNTDQYSGTTTTSDRLLERDANGQFTDIFGLPENAGAANFIAGRSCACIDRDGDGKYGVFVSNYGGPMKLYELNTAGTLTDVAPALGLDRTTGGRALISAPLRSPNGRMDIFANNEGGCNYFYRNTGTGFVEEAVALGVADCQQTGRGTAIVDSDQDGMLDIVYGNWNGPHRLFEQRPTGFTNTAGASTGMSTPSPIRTVIVADWDNDGEEEIFYNNIPGANRLFQRKEGGGWEQRNIGAAMESSGHGTGAAVGDFDGDGRLELLISHGESANEPLTYFRPVEGDGNHWIRVAPLTQHGGPARGATVRLTLNAPLGAAGERVHIRAIDAGSGYLCQMEPIAHFGLGAATAVAMVQVQWPDGSTLTLTDPAIDTLHHVNHPSVSTSGGGGSEDSSGGDGNTAEFTVALSTDLATIPPNSPARDTFEANFVSDMAAVLSVPASAITVLAVRSGSVVVDFSVDIAAMSGSSGNSVNVVATIQQHISSGTGQLAGSAVQSIGAFDTSSSSDSGSCSYAACNFHGTCADGACVCEAGYIGTHCHPPPASTPISNANHQVRARPLATAVTAMTMTLSGVGEPAHFNNTFSVVAWH